MRRGKYLRGLSPGAALLAAGFPSAARASFLPPELMDSVTMGLAWVIIVVVPIALIVLFWMVHVLPEKIAEKRHHPQRDAIHTLCLLSLVFGGLLWPLAWLWAYVKPVGYRAAYGTERHDDYFHAMGDQARAGKLVQLEIDHLRDELDSMAARGSLSPALRTLRADLDRVQPAAAAPATTAATVSAAASATRSG